MADVSYQVQWYIPLQIIKRSVDINFQSPQMKRIPVGLYRRSLQQHILGVVIHHAANHIPTLYCLTAVTSLCWIIDWDAVSITSGKGRHLRPKSHFVIWGHKTYHFCNYWCVGQNFLDCGNCGCDKIPGSVRVRSASMISTNIEYCIPHEFL